MASRDVTERMYLNADRTKIVAGGPEAAYLFKIPGDQITDEEAVRYGLSKPKAAEAREARPPARTGNRRAAARNAEAVNEDDLEPEEDAEAKAAADKPEEDKAADQGGNKSQGPAENKGA